MGLDATVFCDCFETGKIRKPPLQPELVYVEPDGQLSLKWDSPHADQHKFYEWLAEACEHGPMCQLVSHRLGNVALIGFLRERLSEAPGWFPMLLAKVLYDGVHAGDHLSSEDVRILATELEGLKKVHDADASLEGLIRHFERQMHELIDAARRTGKPIAFL